MEEIQYYELDFFLSMGNIPNIEKARKNFISTIEKIARGEEADISDITIIKGDFGDKIDYTNLLFSISPECIPKPLFTKNSELVVPFERLLEAFRGYYYTGIAETREDAGSVYGVYTATIRERIRRNVTQFRIPESGDIIEKDEEKAITGIVTDEGVVDIKKIVGDNNPVIGNTIGVISKYPITGIPPFEYNVLNDDEM